MRLHSGTFPESSVERVFGEKKKECLREQTACGHLGRYCSPMAETAEVKRGGESFEGA